MRALVCVVPVVLAVTVGTGLLWLAARLGGGLTLPMTILAVAFGCALALLIFSLWAERALTLALLLDISMQFPYRPSSRLSIAVRTGSHRQLLRELPHVQEALKWVDSPAGTAAVVDATVRLDRVENVLTLVAILSSLESGTRDHSERVGRMTDQLAAELDLNPESRERLRWAALVHDIGKLAVPLDILNKPGPLTQHEWSVIFEHPLVGARMVAPLEGWLGEWSRAILEHHERWDGSGYPRGLRGEQISLGGRIVAVADSFEVMTSSRVYKKPMSRSAAREELVRYSGTQFDPTVVGAFLAITSRRDRPIKRRDGVVRRLPVVRTLGSAVIGLPGYAALVAVAATALSATVAFGPGLLTAGSNVTAAPVTQPQYLDPPPLGATTGEAPAPRAPRGPAPAPAPARSAPPAILTVGLSAPPVVTVSPGQTITEGGVVLGQGSFAGEGTGWQVTVDYGDGGGAQPQALSGQAFGLSHVYYGEGTYTITALVENAAHQAGTATTRVVVLDYPIVVKIPVSKSWSRASSPAFTLNGTFTDPGNDTWTAWYSIDGGDDVPMALTDHSFRVSRSFPTNGDHTIKITVSDGHSSPSVATTIVHVTD